MKQLVKELTTKVREIMSDFDSDYLPIEDCDIHIQGCILTHCFYDSDSNKIVFTSGDMLNDKHAEEIHLSDCDTINALQDIIESYS